jgi:hypothetical protein
MSSERGNDVKNRAWIGYAFAFPQAIRRIRLEQQTYSPWRQDWVRVQASRDGGTSWIDALPEPVDLREQIVGQISLPELAPAALWRILAVSDNASESNQEWRPLELEFLVADTAVQNNPLRAARLQGGTPQASSDEAGGPERAFDGNNNTYWSSKELGPDVKNRAWIGYRFATPQRIRRINVHQSVEEALAQDYVRVEKSMDGANWFPAAPQPFRLRPFGWIEISDAEPTPYWRLVAAGNNAATSGGRWRVTDIEFYVATTQEAGSERAEHRDVP